MTEALPLLLACPVCARDNAPAAVLLLFLMLAVPYAVAMVVIRAVRRADAEAAERDRGGQS